MALNEVMQKLLSLQDVDRRKRAVEAKIRAGDLRCHEIRDRLAHYQKRLEESTRRAKEAELVEKRKFGEVDEVDRKIRDQSTKQNTARTNKEYEAFKMEIAGMKANRDLLEEEALQQAAAKEQREREAKAEKQKVDALAAELSEADGRWKVEQEGLHTELAQLTAERDQKRQGIPPTWLDRYERLLASIGLPAIVPVVEQYCQGCQMELSIHDVTRAFKAAEVVSCKSCNRMLYAETL
jgi:hypothetical protein